MFFLSLYYTSPFIENSPYKYSDSALLEKTAKSFGNRAVNKRVYEKGLDGAEAISFGGAQCGNHAVSYLPVMFMVTATIISFSSGLLSAMRIVKAAKPSLAIAILPSAFTSIPFLWRKAR